MRNDKNRLIMNFTVIGTALLIIFTSCGPVPFFRTGAPLIDANVSWRSVSSRAIVASPINSSRSVRAVGGTPEFPEALQLLTDYYNSLGNRILTLTPEKFQLVIRDIAILSSEPGVEVLRIFGLNATPFGASPADQDEWRSNLSEEDFYADFTSPLGITPNIRIKSALYDSMTIEVFPANRTWTYQADDGSTIWSYYMKNDVTVEIPGYTNTDLPDIGIDDRVYLDANKFRFTFEELQPINWPSDLPINFFIFTADKNMSEIIIPEYDSVPVSFDPVDYTTSIPSQKF